MSPMRRAIFPLLLAALGALHAAEPVLTPGQDPLVHVTGGLVEIAGSDLDQLDGEAVIGTGSGSSTVAVTVTGAATVSFTAPSRSADTYDLAFPWSGGSVVATLTYRATPAFTAGQSFVANSQGGSTCAVTGSGLDLVSGLSVGGATVAFSAPSSTLLTFTAPAHAAGVVSASATWRAGLSTGSIAASGLITYVDPPTITNGQVFTAGSGGGSRLAVTGSGLDRITAATVGGASATIGAVAADGSSLVVTTPAHAAGVVDLVLTWASGSLTGTVTAAGVVTYEVRPEITTAGPLPVSTQGGAVAIAGSNLNLVSGITVDAVAATITSQSSTSLSFAAPAHALGSATVAATYAGGGPLVRAALLTCLATPAASSATPAVLSVAGGTVSIAGSDLNLVTGVSISGGTASIASQSPTALSVAVGPRSAGSAALALAWDAGGLAGSTSVSLTFRAAPVITAGQKLTAAIAGGTEVTVSGSDLDQVTAIGVAGTSASSAVTVESSARLHVTAPAHAAGTVGVTASYELEGTTGQIAASDLLVYAPGPVVAGGQALVASTVDSTILAIAGSGFSTVTAVSVDDTAATMLTGLTDASLPIRVPALAAGAHAVTMTWIAAGASASAAATVPDLITAVAPPDPVTPPFASDGGGGGCGLGGVAAVLAGALLLALRRRP